MSEGKIIIKNAHCKFFEGQTNLCKAKEFTKCNPVNCKLYTIDELSTILELQEKLQAKKQECEELKGKIKKYSKINEQDTKDFAKYSNALDEIEEFCTVYSDNHDAYKTVYKYILDIINKVKE